MKKILRKITTFVALAVIMCIFAVCFITGTAATEYNSGDWKYTVSNNKATVTGYTGTATTLNFPTTLGGYPVVSIGKGAFQNNSKITSVNIPEGYTAIGERAFSGCSYLKSVSIPATIRYIGDDSSYEERGESFKDCIRLETVTFAEGGTHNAIIKQFSFSGCTALKSITIPANYVTIHGFAFRGCSALETLTIKENEDKFTARTIDYEAFSYCTSLKSVNIPEGFTMIGQKAFLGCSHLKSVSIPATIRYIGDDSSYEERGESFKDCIRLETVTFAEGGTHNAIIKQ
ncbi:MAG: leucine-rich repeat protein, partial [Clostridia bacterium]|nr:leucine-rich repeat protein [Clostridia bacterium]